MFPLTLDLSFLGMDEIRGYEGLYFFLSFVVAIVLFMPRRMKALGMTGEQLSTMIVLIVIFSLVGAKLSHLLAWDWKSLENVKSVRDLIFGGGASITGGLIFGVFGAWVYARWKKVHIGSLFDTGAPLTMFSLFVGRIGCFLNGDSHGTKTDLPWGIPVPAQDGYTFCVPGGWQVLPPRSEFANGVCGYEPAAGAQPGAGHVIIDPSFWGSSVHPTQLYEALGALLIGLAIVLVIEKQGWLKNRVIWFVSFCYGWLRFGIEFVRNEFVTDNLDDLWFPDLGLNNAQIIALGMVLIGLIGMIWFKGQSREDFERIHFPKGRPEAPAPAKSSGGKKGASAPAKGKAGGKAKV